MPIKAISLLLLVLCGCTPRLPDVEVTNVSMDFFRQYLYVVERTKNFRNYSIEEQYEIYLFGRQVAKPPAIYLTEVLAERGEEIVPFLRRKLENAKTNITIRDILNIYEEMAWAKNYDFSKDPELMDFIEERVAGMKGIWKEKALLIICKINVLNGLDDTGKTIDDCFFESGAPTETPIADLEVTDITMDFFRQYLSIDERMKMFRNYNLEEQYEIYLFGSEVAQPPAMYLAGVLAERGEEIVPFLRGKLESAKTVMTIIDILSIFDEMRLSKSYDFSKDPELMDLIEERAAGLNIIFQGNTIRLADVEVTDISMDFFRQNLSIDEEMKMFRNYSLEDQYEIYLFGNQVVHPATSYLAEVLAERGVEIIPFLRRKLEDAKAEITIHDIINVYEEMAWLKSYDFSKDLELMDSIEERVDGMKGIYKESALISICNIKVLSGLDDTGKTLDDCYCESDLSIETPICLEWQQMKNN